MRRNNQFFFQLSNVGVCKLPVMDAELIEDNYSMAVFLDLNIIEATAQKSTHTMTNCVVHWDGTIFRIDSECLP